MTYACDVEDVPPGEGRALTLGDRRIALFRSADGWYALDNACPHAGGPLSDGIVCDHSVTCPLHDRRFALDTGAGLGGTADSVLAHRVEVRDSQVFVTLATEASRPTARAA